MIIQPHSPQFVQQALTIHRTNRAVPLFFFVLKHQRHHALTIHPHHNQPLKAQREAAHEVPLFPEAYCLAISQRVLIVLRAFAY